MSELSDSKICQTFILNGFTVKEGQSDLKPYVYAAARAIIAEDRAQHQAGPYDQTALELCDKCGWKTLIPGDECLNCEREQRQAGQEPVAWQDRAGKPHLRYRDAVLDFEREPIPLYTTPQPAAQPAPVCHDWNRDIDAAQFIEQRALIDGKDTEIAALTAERDNALDLWTVAHAERSAEMMRGAEQEAEIAALKKLLREAGATLDMWSDVAPAVSLCTDIAQAVQL